MNSMSGLEPAGCVHLYVGDGKGKTTCAAGLAVRAVGAGKRVLFCQFLKGRESGEIAGLEKLGIRTMRAKTGTKFVFQMNDAEREQLKKSHESCIAEVHGLIFGNEVDVVVLDELVDAINCGLIRESAALDIIGGRPSGVEIVMTGRNPPQVLIDASDYYTEFVCKKHPYSNGIAARKGIEF